MTTSRFSEWFAFGALACWMALGVTRALMMRARGVSVFVVDRQRTGRQKLADTVMLACLLTFPYEIIAYAWQLRFHIGPALLERPVVEGLASHALGALLVTGAVILYVLALRDLGASWRLGFDRRAPGPLVTGGVYGWTRHPIYVAFDLWFVGTFLLIGRLSFLVLALVWVPLLHAMMDREERFLTGLYGEAYRDYARRVGRYFFRQRHGWSRVADLALTAFTRMKKKTVIRVVVALLLLAVTVRFAWILVLSTSSDKSAPSPDKRYVAAVSSRWSRDFWFGAAHDRHDIRILGSDGRRIRWMVMDDQSGGWPQECTIRWADDSSSVTVAFKREELDSARVVIPVRP